MRTKKKEAFVVALKQTGRLFHDREDGFYIHTGVIGGDMKVAKLFDDLQGQRIRVTVEVLKEAK